MGKGVGRGRGGGRGAGQGSASRRADGAGVGCAAVDTSATAITAALYKDSPNFGAVMGISESMISIGYAALGSHPHWQHDNAAELPGSADRGWCWRLDRGTRACSGTLAFFRRRWVVGPMAGGSLASLFGFGAPFYVVGVLALLFTPIALLVLPADGACQTFPGVHATFFMKRSLAVHLLCLPLCCLVAHV